MLKAFHLPSSLASFIMSVVSRNFSQTGRNFASSHLPVELLLHDEANVQSPTLGSKDHVIAVESWYLSAPLVGYAIV